MKIKIFFIAIMLCILTGCKNSSVYIEDGDDIGYQYEIEKVVQDNAFSGILTGKKVPVEIRYGIGGEGGYEQYSTKDSGIISEYIEAFKEITGGNFAMTLADFGTLTLLYAPVAFVVFAEHIADHKNISSIIEKDLLEDPGLHRTLLGDGVGSIAGAFFGGCPNTTYGESVGCVAITRNASVITVTVAALMCIVISFFGPFVAFLDSIPGCVMGGVCITLYGFIAVSGLKMIQKVNLEDNANLFTVSVILITGIGGMAMAIGKVTITAIACALILGIIVNIVLHKNKAE